MTPLELDPITRLTRDLKKSAGMLSPSEARYLVDAYYAIQEYRKASHNQVLALTKTEEPCDVIAWLESQMETLESQIKRALDAWTDQQPVGQWAKSIFGIGPVISAGLLAHIDITKAPTVGHIWRFAGLDPTVRWEKGKKRPWNASLKTLCWKIGQSFTKFSNNEKDFYGHLWRERLAYEEKRNAAMELSDQAADKLARFKIGKDTDAYAAYSVGKLPPAHLRQRAARWAVKLFLCHYQAVAYRYQFGVDPPKPYVIEHMGHADLIQVPNWPF